MSELKKTNLTKLKSALKCAEDADSNWNRFADDLDHKKFGWAWDCQGVALAAASEYCSCALFYSAYEGTKYEYDFFKFLRPKMEQVKEAIIKVAELGGFERDDLINTYNRHLGLAILERKRMYPYADSSINKIDSSHRGIVEFTTNNN